MASQSGGSLTVDLSKDGFGYGQWKFQVRGANQVEASTVISYQAQTYILSGTYGTGLGEAAAQVTGIVFTPTTDSFYEVPEVVLDTGAYTYRAVLEKGTTYEIAVEGADEYEMIVPEEAFSYSQDTTLNLVFEKTVTYPVTINLGATPDLTGMNISYTFVHEDGSEYKFADDSDIMLRNGDYRVSLGGDFEQLPFMGLTEEAP